MNNYQKELCKEIQGLGCRYDANRVFCDFLESSAIEISNAVDPLHYEEREKRYIEIMKSYEKLEERQKFCKMFTDLVEALEYNVTSGAGPEDVLGPVFHELELHNQYKGQFFTPQSVSDMMGAATAERGSFEKVIKEKGYIAVDEPACGSGVMILSLAKALQKEKLNYCQQMVVSATDVDLKCIHMAYIQLSLYGIPAVVIHGNTLSMEEWSRWYTPVYLADNWLWRQTCGSRSRHLEDEQLKMIFNPQYAAIRQIFGYGSGKRDEEEKTQQKEVKQGESKQKKQVQQKHQKEVQQKQPEPEIPSELAVANGEMGQLKFKF